MFNQKQYIPIEIVDLIADYHDYDKYIKPIHKEKLNLVLKDIKTMSEIMHPIIPNISYMCWGNGWKYLENRE
tara:strand:+ start:68 stop:283 length:216 start_codon:yes stop_codon:yes gene_type:complete